MFGTLLICVFCIFRIAVSFIDLANNTTIVRGNKTLTVEVNAQKRSRRVDVTVTAGDDDFSLGVFRNIPAIRPPMS